MKSISTYSDLPTAGFRIMRIPIFYIAALLLAVLTINVQSDTIETIWTISDATLWTESGNISREETHTKCPTTASCWQLTGSSEMYRHFTVHSVPAELSYRYNVRTEGFDNEDQLCSIQFNNDHEDEEDEQWTDLIAYSGIQGDGIWTDQSSPRISINDSHIGIKIALQNAGPGQSCYINGLQIFAKS